MNSADIINKCDIIRHALGTKTKEARVLSQIQYRICSALTAIETFEKTFKENRYSSSMTIANRLDETMQAVEFMRLVAPITSLLMNPKPEEALDLLKDAIRVLEIHVRNQVSDRFFNPMNSTSPYRNLQNIQSQKACLEVFHIFEFVKKEDEQE